MNFKGRFMEGIRGRVHPWPVEPGDFREAPALQDDDVAFILREHLARKFEGREYMDAEGRPIVVNGGNGDGPKKEARSKGKGSGIFRLIRILLNKKGRLQREVEKLENETISEK